MAKNVVITGATSGIGEAIARAYLEQGENVVLIGRRTDRLEVLKSEFAEVFPNQTVWTFPLDVTDMAMVKTVCPNILETIGKIDILVNNAGLALGLAPYQDYEELDMLTMLDTNVKGLMAVTRCFLPAMVKANQGHIINMGRPQEFMPMQVQLSIQRPRQRLRPFQMVCELMPSQRISR